MGERSRPPRTKTKGYSNPNPKNPLGGGHDPAADPAVIIAGGDPSTGDPVPGSHGFVGKQWEIGLGPSQIDKPNQGANPNVDQPEGEPDK
jgi:hypothetical protein